jgi:polyhydroxybutyrate depolymerase
VLVSGIAIAALVGCATGRQSSDSPVIVPAAVQSVQTLLDVGGVERTVTIRDAASATALVPAVILLHGATGSAAVAEEATGMTDLAEQDGFVVAYPDGTTTGRAVGGEAWNAGRCCATPVEKQVDDVAFLRAVIDELVSRHGVDPNRVYLGGFSNGGMMSYRMVCEDPSGIAGIFVVGGALNLDCRAPSGLPVLIIHGTDDATVPYAGGSPNPVTAANLGTWANASVSDAAAYWSARNGCTASVVALDTPGHSEDVYSGCADGTSLDVLTVKGGVHKWPTLDRTDFDASSFIVGYFAIAA